MNKVYNIYGKMFVLKIIFKTNYYLLVDWASLAQQWIKMKETPPPMLHGQQDRILTSEHTLPSQHVEPQNPSNAAAGTNITLNDHTIASPAAR
jgi:hypothetical protein